MCDVVRVDCDVKNATSYSKGCEVLSCDVGLKVSANKTKCDANQCKCLNGVGASEAKCPRHGALMCERCNPGFKLASNAKSCNGMLWRLNMIAMCSIARLTHAHIRTHLFTTSLNHSLI